MVIKDFFDSLMWLFISPIDSRIRLYFPTHKLEIEVDEKGHTDRDKKKKKKMKERKKYKNNLVVNLLELILMKKIMMSKLNLVKKTH